MTGFLTDEEIARLTPSEMTEHRTPIPTQVVSSDEYYPAPQNEKQREVELRLLDMADDLGQKQGLDRRGFFRTAAGMAAAFVAMNEVYGSIFDATPAEAATPALAQERADALKDQLIMDMHTHFLRDDTRITTFLETRKAISQAGWNPELAGKEQTLEDLKFANYIKEIFLDSDTKIALISSAPSDIERDWFLTNEQMAAARDKVNNKAAAGVGAEVGTKRLLAHAVFTPGQPGWLEKIDAALALKPDSMKGYTIGDNTHKQTSHYPWRIDDEKVTYKGYEKFVQAGIKNVCIHKGLFPPSVEKSVPNLRGYVDVSDVGQAAKDWPQLNFVIYHSGYRYVGDTDVNREPALALAEFERTERIAWASDLADIPEQYGVDNVYGDLGQVIAMTLVSQPRLCAAVMGILLKGLGIDRVCWGTDALWTGSPQWQIEGLRRLEIPDDMQKRYGFKPLGTATGSVKTAIFSGNNARLYNIDPKKAEVDLKGDRFAQIKAEYEEQGPERSNLRYGYVNNSIRGSCP
jgi:predicted TIM-barrel fold metal-dependent hydrolase